MRKHTQKISFPTPTLLVLAMASIGAAAAQAQTATTTLKSMVVSAARYEQTPFDLPLRLDVVTAEDMEARQIGDIKDAVADLPNVSVKHAPARFRIAGQPSSVGRDGNSGFTIRGLGGNRVLMLADGIRLPRSYTNGNTAFGRDTLSLGLVKRIEIVRGPSSVLYGSDGIAGLVHFISFEPVDFLTNADGSVRPLGGRVALGWSGDDQATTGAATVAGRASDTLDWMLTATARSGHAMDNMGSNDTASASRTRPNPESDRATSLLGKIVWRPTAGQKHVVALEHVEKASSVELLSSVGSTVRLVNPTVTALVSQENGNQGLSRDRLTWDASYRIDQPWADLLQTVLGSQRSDAHDDGLTTIAQTPAVTRTRDTRYREDSWQASIRAEKTLPLGAGWSQRISYGYDHAQTDITSWFGGVDSPAARFSLPFVAKKFFPDTRDTSDALFLQSEMANDRWIITPGVRWEQFSIAPSTQDGYGQPAIVLSGTQVTPKLGAVLRVQDDWNVFASYATGFRAPNATQLNGFSENTSAGYATYLSNPDLKPETSKNLELGVRGSGGPLSFQASAFYGDYNQLIVDKKLISGNPANCGAAPGCVYQSVNVDSATIWGAELSGSYDWGRHAGGRWSTPFVYGLARGRDNGSGKPLNSVDPALATLGLAYATEGWTARLDLHYHAAKNASEVDPTAGLASGTQYADMPEATTVDLFAQWRLSKKVRLQASIMNLTDRKYWLWSDVQGLTSASAATQLDAFTQPGRHANVSVVVEF